MPLNPSIWLDKTRAVPTVGLRFDATFETASSAMSRLRNLLAKWKEKHGPIAVGIEKDFVLKIERADGYEVVISQNSAVCRFYYLSEVVQKGHAQPVMQYKTKVRPFGDLLKDGVGHLMEVVTELSKDGVRSIDRIGFVAAGNVDPDGLPPGFERYMNHVGRPWGGSAAAANGTVVAELRRDEETTDKCHHMLKWNHEDSEAVVEFSLDWQRYWKKSMTPATAKLKVLLDDTSELAMSYFGKFGLGGLNYANDK